jgi:hypothetical protein
LNCSVCGTHFGLWSRMSGQASEGVCEDCCQSGDARLETVVREATPSADVGKLISTAEAIASKYCVKPAKLERIRGQIIEACTVAFTQREHIKNEDILALNDIINRVLTNEQKQNLEPAMVEAVARINKRGVIDNWDPADPPAKRCSGLLLLKGEICRWEEAARMYEQRTRRQYAGASQSVSFPLGHGLRYRVGSFRGTPIDTSYLSDCGPGILHITSQRVCFCSPQRSAVIPWKKVINVAVFDDGLSINQTGAKKAMMLGISSADLTMQILNRVAPSAV